MVCEKIVAEFEKRLKRKLTLKEKRQIEEKCHHKELSEPKAEEIYA